MDTLRQLAAVTNAAKPEPAGLSRALAEALQKNRELESKLAIATARPLAITPKAPNKPTTPVSVTPLSDQLATLTGAEKTSFYRENADALRSEQITAKHPTAIIPNTKTA